MTQDAAAREDALNREAMRRKSKRALHKITPTLLDRIYARVKAVPPPRGEHYRHLDPVLPCLIWQGAKGKCGHGQIGVNGKNFLVHRVIFKSAYGRLPEVVAHLCDRADCVAVYHLEQSTFTKNLHDAKVRGLRNGVWKRGATHCPKGHDLTLPGAVIHDTIHRYCHECRKATGRARSRERYAKDSAYRDKRVVQSRAYRATQRDEILTRLRERRATDPVFWEKRKAANHAYRAAHRDEINARERIKRRVRRATEPVFREKQLARTRAWHKAHPEKAAEYYARRKARLCTMDAT